MAKPIKTPELRYLMIQYIDMQFDMQFHLIVVSIFLKTCERSWTR